MLTSKFGSWRYAVRSFILIQFVDAAAVRILFGRLKMSRWSSIKTPEYLHSSGPCRRQVCHEDESIEDIFGNTTLVLVDGLIDRVYGGDSSKISAIDYLGAKPAAVPRPTGVEIAEARSQATYTLGATLFSVSISLQEFCTFCHPNLSPISAGRLFYFSRTML